MYVETKIFNINDNNILWTESQFEVGINSLTENTLDKCFFQISGCVGDEISQGVFKSPKKKKKQLTKVNKPGQNEQFSVGLHNSDEKQ